MAMYSCLSRCICTRCVRTRCNCAECKHSVKRTKDCIETGIKECEYFKEKR